MTWVRHRLDIGTAAAARAGLRSIGVGCDAVAGREIVAALAGESAIISLSARAGFHLLLCALELPRGDEVVFTAITHPGMARIAELHGLRVLPVDLERDTLCPDPILLARAIGPRTRMIVVAHLFGGRVDLAPIRALADAHGLLLVEDCAQALGDPSELAERTADVSIYSFGMIKTATALGGGVVRVTDRDLTEQLAMLQAGWPCQSRRAYAKRALIATTLTIVQRRRVYRQVVRAATRGRVDLNGILARLVRGMPPADPGAFRAALERRPTDALVATIGERLRAFDRERIGARMRNGNAIQARLPGAAVPGRAVLHGTHWLFPIASDHGQAVVLALAAAGYDASRATTSICAIAAPADRPDLDPVVARSLLEQVVFVPTYAEIDEAAIDRLAAVLVGVIAEAAP